MVKLKVGNTVVVKNGVQYGGQTGVITTIRDNGIYPIRVNIDKRGEIGFEGSELLKVTEINQDKTQISLGNSKNFTKIGTEIGEFTDKKNLQYGSSVDATSKIIHILLERYTYDDSQYLIPKSLIEHILLQSRMMDKQNRIFNNPSGEGDSESPYNDLAGYSLIGIEMTTGGDSK